MRRNSAQKLIEGQRMSWDYAITLSIGRTLLDTESSRENSMPETCGAVPTCALTARSELAGVNYTRTSDIVNCVCEC